LLFPWRLSVFIVPIAVTIILAYLVTHLLDLPPLQIPKSKRWVQLASFVIIICSVVVGVTRFKLDLERKMDEPERAIENYIYTQHIPGEVYLTPIKLQDFRLNSGAPAFVDFKSIPYKDADVLEWYRRVRLAERFYKNLDCSLLARMVEEDHVTHAIIEADQPDLECPSSFQIYHDKDFVLYRLAS